jgi:phosphoserine phosphatase RsbU/P
MGWAELSVATILNSNAYIALPDSVENSLLSQRISGRLPSYLRLHADESPPAPPQLAPRDAIERLERSFAQATGWKMTLPQAGSANSKAISNKRVRLTRHSSSAAAAAPSAETMALAESCVEVLQMLQDALVALHAREAELAAAIPVSARPDRGNQLAQKLASTLEIGAQSLCMSAAAVYLLDEATSSLKMRSGFGFPKEKLLEPARPLRGALADLEAMLGAAVTIEDSSANPQWFIPEEFPSGICVPLASQEHLLGTVWFFSKEVRPYTDPETGLAEVIAGRIVAELEREALLTEAAENIDSRRQLEEVRERKGAKARMPKPLIDEWDVAQWSLSESPCAFVDWSIRGNGSLAIALGDSHGARLDAELTSTALHTALRAHASYQPSSKTLLSRVNETIWSSSLGDQFVSLFHGVVDSDRRVMDFASAGRLGCWFINRRGADRVSPLDGLLGNDPDSKFRQRRRTFHAGDYMLVLSESAGREMDLLCEDDEFLRTLAAWRKLTAETISDELRRCLTARSLKVDSTSCFLVLRRRS